MLMQSVIRAIYPPQCVVCDTATEADFGLCGTCWRETQFIEGTICDCCGMPLPGDAQDEILLCDACMTTPRPWKKGRATFAYSDMGRRIVLSLKHGDRTDLARPAAGWMARVAAPLVTENTLIVPVPLHWSRLIKRRFNQASLLAQGLGRVLDVAVSVDALQRFRRTKPLEGHSRDARFAALAGVVRAHPKHGKKLAGRSIILVDDVMTSGATMTACTQACLAANAENVSIVTLARVTKDT